MKTSLADVKSHEIMPGFLGKFVHTGTMTFAYWNVAKGAVLPEHKHPHEQVVNVLEGELEITAGGITHLLKAGDILPIAGDTLHSGRALTEVRVLDVFNPVREDYRKG
jgi:quercetin dioxygenase-like cupin family protein